MEILIYAARCILMLLITWTGIRIIGKKSIAQITSYDLAGILLLTTAAAEPLVYKIPSKALEAVIVISLCLIAVGKLSLTKKVYNADQKPSIVICNGKIDMVELRKNNLNVPFLLSQLRLKNYFKISEIEFALVEPNGQISVLPKSPDKPLTPKDMQVTTHAISRTGITFNNRWRNYLF